MAQYVKIGNISMTTHYMVFSINFFPKTVFSNLIGVKIFVSFCQPYEFFTEEL